MSQPKILLLDEPSLGLSPLLVKDLFAILRRIIAEDSRSCWWSRMPITASSLADHVYVLENGRIVRSGSAADIVKDAAVQQAYLGGAAAH